MKKLSLFDKFLYIVNFVLALILLVSYSSYYLSPNFVPIISVLSLFVPVLILLIGLFLIYWVVKFKKVFLLSLVVLLLGFQHISVLYNFKEKKVMLTDDVKIMTYNVRAFNIFKWIDEENIEQKIIDFVKEKDPDILCFQEYHKIKKELLKFPFEYLHRGQAIYSKFKIVNTGSLDFSNTTNNAIFVDILKDNDTVRIYNVHLESLRINPEKEEITQENSEKLKIRLENGFKIQTNQVALILHHQSRIQHQSIICGDFNNTAFSWVYKQLKQGKNDAFEEAGSGFGATYNFKVPVRIDFILPDENLEINNFKTYKVKYSDHFPIMARLNF